MSENAKNSAAQNAIQDPPEYNAENVKHPFEQGSDRLGGPQNGNETPSESTYQQNGQSWLGGPQNGNETPGESDYTKHRFNETSSEASKQAPDRSGSQALTDDLDGTSSNDASWTGRGKA